MTTTISHYTSFDTFIKIVNSIRVVEMQEGKKDLCFIFHATSILEQTDSSELYHGLELIWDVLKEIERKRNIPTLMQVTRLLNDKGQNNADSWKKCIVDFMREEEIPYIVCFSKEDYTPMWTHYADNGNGVCITFKESLLTSTLTGESFNMSKYIETETVEYSPITDFDTEYKHIDKLYTLYLNNCKQVSSQFYLETFKQIFIKALMRLLAFSRKHSDFAYEEEKRIIVYGSERQPKKYKNSNNKVISYLEVAIPVKYLHCIYVGPCADYYITKKEIEKLLHEKGVEDINVRKSCSTYRKR